MATPRIKYPRPRIVSIGRGQVRLKDGSGLISTDNLYRAEENAVKALQRAAIEIGAVLEFDVDKQQYSHCIPHALASLLDHFEPESSVRAAECYLLHRKVEDLKHDMQRVNLLGDAYGLLLRMKKILPEVFKEKPPLAVEEWQAALATFEQELREG